MRKPLGEAWGDDTLMKIICKFCNKTQPDLPELRTHVRGHHPKEWQSFAKSMALYDQAHAAELSATCPICPHRGKHAH